MTNEQKLEKQISEALAAYYASGAETARAALERAIGGSAPTDRSGAKKQRRHRAGYSRRSGEELARLCDALCAAVAARPGESLATLAAQLGEKSSRLATVVKRVKEQGRIRTAGSRQFTRYFPATQTALESAA
jgi:hypothetical protein